MRLAEQSPFYIFTAFVFSYGIATLKVSRDFLFAVAATVGVFGFVYFGMLNTGSLAVIFIAIVISLIPHDMMHGPQAALGSMTSKTYGTGAGPPAMTEASW